MNTHSSSSTSESIEDLTIEHCTPDQSLVALNEAILKFNNPYFQWDNESVKKFIEGIETNYDQLIRVNRSTLTTAIALINLEVLQVLRKSLAD